MITKCHITCSDPKHKNQTATCICLNEFCQNNRIYCFICYQEGKHVGHLKDVHQISDLPTILSNQAQNCEKHINQLQDSINKAQELLNQLASSLRQRYQITEEQILELTPKQQEQVISEIMQWEKKKETLIITTNIESLCAAFNSCIYEFNVDQLEYCQKLGNSQKYLQLQYRSQKILLSSQDQIKILKLKIISQNEKDQAIVEHLKLNSHRLFQSILLDNEYEIKVYCLNLIKITKFQSNEEDIQKILYKLGGLKERNILGKIISSFQ